MGAKQKILVFILLVAIFAAFFFGWQFIMKKPLLTNIENFSSKDKASDKIVAMLQTEKNKNTNYDDLLNKYKELKNQRISLDDQISDVEQQIAKINKANPNTVNAGDANIVVLTDEKIKQNQNQNQNQNVSSTYNVKTQDVSGNALSPAPIVALASSESDKVKKALPAAKIEATNPSSVVNVTKPLPKITIISAKKKHDKQTKMLAAEQTQSLLQEKNTIEKNPQNNDQDVQTASESSTESEPMITVTKNSVDEGTMPPKSAEVVVKATPSKDKPISPVSSTAINAEEKPAVKAAVVTKPTVTVPSQAKYYVVQLMGSDKASDIADFIKRKNLSDKTVVLKTERDGKDWYIAAYGNYDSSREASSAIKSLPGAIKSLHPWVKPINSSEVTAISE